MKVADGMQKNPVTISPETPVSEVARAMIGGNSRHVVVTDGARGILGLITAADLIAKHAKLHFPAYFSLLGFAFPVESWRDDREIEKALAATAGDLMTTNLVTVPSNTDVDDAAQLMLDHEVSCLPVVDNGLLVGTLDESDIVRILVVEESATA